MLARRGRFGRNRGGAASLAATTGVLLGSPAAYTPGMRLALLPGLGARSSMYGPEFGDLADEVLRVDWPEHRDERSIAALAERMLAEDPLAECEVLVGSSLGGMVGAEIALRTSPRMLVLVGSARHPREVNMLLRQLAKMGDRMPIEHLQNLMGLDFLAGRAEILDHLAAADPDQVRAMAAAIFSWEGCADPGCPSPRIHGAWDLVIPPPSTGAEIIGRAGHMIAMTHGDRVVTFVREALAELG